MKSRANAACWLMMGIIVLSASAGWFGSSEALGQVASAAGAAPPRALAAHVIVPQSRDFHVSAAAARPQPVIQIVEVTAGVVIAEQVATTTIDVSLKNPTSSRLEAELVMPVPDGAVVRGFSFEGAAKEPTAELLRKEDAKKIYSDIVAKTRDPALLEFIGYNTVRSSVFPVEANGTQKIRLTYENLLPADGDRVDYVLPRSESLDYNIPWKVSVKIKSASAAISTVYSPSHQIETERGGPKAISVKVAGSASTEPGSFRLSYLLQRDGVTASLLAYPDRSGDGGYFLLLAGLPTREADAPPAMKRELTIVIDRSGSMSGEKIEQVRAAALQVVEGLAEGEAFNIIDYSDNISSFASAPVVKDKDNAEKARHYIRKLSAGGGTNLLDALLEAVRPKPSEGMLPLVLFLTDGLPTVGERDEVAIRTAVEKANAYKRRIFTFGVGYDVNAPLLTNLANTSRAISTFVLPKEDVEVKVSQVFRRLSGPALAGPTLATVNAEGKAESGRVTDLLPRELPDLFDGDNLVLLGRYKGEAPLGFQLKGNYQGKEKTFQFKFDLKSATNRNDFVPRLWASRKIAFLIEQIRQAGAATAGRPTVLNSSTPADPKMKELVDEIVRLSMEFGILTEYTAFLAKEGTDLTHKDAIMDEANANFVRRAVDSRSGMGAVNQSINGNSQANQLNDNRRNEFLDQNMKRVQIARVQQMNDRALFQQGSRWVDSKSIKAGKVVEPDVTVTVGSSEYFKLVDRLAEQNRNGTIALQGEILLNVDGKNYLVKSE